MSSTAAAAAAAAHKKMIDEEEERMTTYSTSDLHGWEFKILRSNLLSFKNPETLQTVLAEEKEAGWELVEKFDDARLRLKRKITERDRDGQRTIDPYRATYGAGTGTVLFWVILGLLVFILFVGMLGSVFSGR